MIEVPVFNSKGDQIETLSVDEQRLGGTVRTDLLKQALVRYHANRRQGTVKTKSRGQVTGSTRKLYKQKGTGNARAGSARTNIRRGGGMAFRKDPRDYSKRMPAKARRLARNSALLSKLQSQDAVIIDQLSLDSPKTKTIAQVFAALKIDRSCLLTLAQSDRNVYLSARNMPRTEVTTVGELNAWSICNKKKMLLTKDAAKQLFQAEE